MKYLIACLALTAALGCDAQPRIQLTPEQLTQIERERNVAMLKQYLPEGSKVNMDAGNGWWLVEITSEGYTYKALACLNEQKTARGYFITVPIVIVLPKDK